MTTFTEAANWFAAYDAAARRLYGITNMVVTVEQDRRLCREASKAVARGVVTVARGQVSL